MEEARLIGYGDADTPGVTMPSKVLIANRGEIAVRVIRTCQERGIATVAVYSDLDRNAKHVRLADEAYAIGGQTAAESYLNTDAILDVLLRSGADAVHPGYGFFSENADFARAVVDAGAKWIGPPPSAIEVMGDKISAREAATSVGVEGVPGTTDMITSVDDVLAFGEKFGYPIAIKAAYGGGGRGMKVVESPEKAAEALESAQREALAYFGRDEAYMERYLVHPRHVEVQIMADSSGRAVYLGTRDCSVQRRHQKLIEEAPAPGIEPAILAAMGQAAVKVAEGCNYVNAGTVEFLYEDGKFYYLEMNTRLQVEHCVTEQVVGYDLVGLQLDIADGKALPFTQDEVQISGHSFECRINAEDPTNGGFLPSPGPLTKLLLPDGYGVRVDGGYDEGDEISQFYDNLVAKVITTGADREEARRRMLRALRELQVEGVKTTVPAQIAVLEHDTFIDGQHSTKWLENEVDPASFGTADNAPIAVGEDAPELTEQIVPVEVDGKRFQVKVWLPDAPAAPAATGGGGRKRTKRSGAGSAGQAADSGSVTAPMQGTVIKVLVEAGDAVEEGQTVVVLEAMKMENNIAAGKAGTVSAVNVEPGVSASPGDILVTIE